MGRHHGGVTITITSMGSGVGKDHELFGLAIILRDQVSALDERGVVRDTVQVCLDLGYPLQAVQTAVDFLGVDGIEPAVLARLRHVVGLPESSGTDVVTA